MAITTYQKNGRTLFRVDYRVAGIRERQGGLLSKKEAEAFLERETVGPRANESSAVKLDVAMNEYLATVSSGKARTLQILEQRWLSKLCIYLNRIRRKKFVHQVELIDLEIYQNLLAEKVSGGTVNRRFDTFKSFFNKCVDWGVIERTPAERLKRLPHRSERRKTWRKDEVAAIHRGLPKGYADLFYFIVKTGSRPGEARLLTWADVDLKNELVKLRSIKGGQGELVRDFPLTDDFLVFMKNHWAQAKKNMMARKSDLVFPSKDGRHFNEFTLQKRVKKLARKLKLTDGLCVYGLRHTFTTAALERDISIEKVRLLVGHEKITTTQGYAHVSQDSLRAAVKKIGRRLG
jgi:integrase